jgi:hypothetical protein
MEIVLTNYDDLIEFISRPDVSADFGAHIVQKYLGVIILFDKNKNDLIDATKIYIISLGKYKSFEKPIFLDCDIDVIK